MERLSKDAATVLHALYSQFQARRKSGESRSDACCFGSPESISHDFCPRMLPSDVYEAMCELGRNGYLVNDYGDNTISHCELTGKAIVDCENATRDKVLSAAEFIAQFIP